MGIWRFCIRSLLHRIALFCRKILLDRRSDREMSRWARIVFAFFFSIRRQCVIQGDQREKEIFLKHEVAA